MSLNVLTQGGGAGGASASIFVTGLDENSAVKAVQQIPPQALNPLHRGIPNGYTQLEYIQTSGTQYIDTGVVGKSGIEVNAEIMWMSISGDESAIGSRSGDNRIYPIDLDGGKWSLGYGTNNVSSVSPSANTKYTVYSKLASGSQILKVNGTTLVSKTSTTTYNTAANMWMPTTNYGGVSQEGSVRIYRLDISVDGVLTRDFVPAKRKSDNAVGMYDIVQGVFYANKGSGTFTAGAEIPKYVDIYVDGKTVQGKWVQKQNPECVLPSGYTQLEYIESTGTQYINTGIVPSNHMTEASFYTPSMKNNTSVFGTSSGWKYYNVGQNTDGNGNTWNVGYNGAGNENAATWSAGNHIIIFNSIDNHICTLDGVQLSSGTAAASTTNVMIFNGEGCFTGRYYYFKMTDRNTNKLVRDFVPAKRNSDGVVGMYDLVNSKFYTNAGTGAFIAGAEIPQYIYGHLISKIKEYGMWTVTATNGEQTKTQDVLVDAAIDFHIQLNYKTYLYYRGNNIANFYQSYYRGQSGSITFNSDHVDIYGYYPDAADQTTISMRSTDKVDVSKYNKLVFVVDSITGSPWYVAFGLSNSSPMGSAQVAGAYVDTKESRLTSGTIEVDISDINTQHYVEVCMNTGRNVTAHVKISEIWLE